MTTPFHRADVAPLHAFVEGLGVVLSIRSVARATAEYPTPNPSRKARRGIMFVEAL
jgi:hypothetical protein